MAALALLLAEACRSTNFANRHVSIFAAPEHAASLRQRQQNWKGVDVVDLVVGSIGPAPVSARDSRANPVTNHWLIALATALKAAPVSCVAFLCGGVLGRHNGVLDLTEPGGEDTQSSSPPEDRQVAVPQFVQFLDLARATSVALLPVGRRSATHALRRFQFELAQVQSRPVLLLEDLALRPERELAENWLAIADGRRTHDFGTAAAYVPDDWLDSTGMIDAVRENLAPLVASLRSSAVDVTESVALGASSLATTVVTSVLRKFQRVDPKAVEKLVDGLKTSLEESGRQLPPESRPSVERFVKRFGPSAASSAERAIRAGQAQAEAWLRDLDRSVGSPGEPS